MKSGNPRELASPLYQVARWLDEVGLLDLCACANPLHPREAPLRRARDAAPHDLQSLADLFLLGTPVAEAALDAVPAPVVATLEQSRILRREADTVSLGGLVLRWLGGLWLLSESAHPNPKLYFGDDSVALLHRLAARPGDRALDLCAGPGAQALRLAAQGADVVAVEINPVAAALAQVNARLNDLQQRITVLVGNLYEPVRGRSFDRITCNPPLLPLPDDIPYPFVGHGGSDGMRVTRKVLHGLPSVLSERGVARLLGTGLSDGYVPMFIDDLESWAISAGLRITVHVTSHHPLHPGTPFYEGLCDTSAATGEIGAEAVRTRFAAFLGRAKCDHLCAYFMHATRGRGGISLIDCSDEGTRDLWFAG